MERFTAVVRLNTVLVESSVIGEGVEVRVRVEVLVGIPRKLEQNGVTEIEALERAVAIAEAWGHTLGAAFDKEARARKENLMRFLDILYDVLSQNRCWATDQLVKMVSILEDLRAKGNDQDVCCDMIELLYILPYVLLDTIVNLEATVEPFHGP